MIISPCSLGPKNPFRAPLGRLQKVPLVHSSNPIPDNQAFDLANGPIFKLDQIKLIPDTIELGSLTYGLLCPTTEQKSQKQVGRTTLETEASGIPPPLGSVINSTSSCVAASNQPKVAGNNNNNTSNTLSQQHHHHHHRYSCSNLMVTEYVVNSEISNESKVRSSQSLQGKVGQKPYQVSDSDDGEEDTFVCEEYLEFEGKNLDQQVRRLSSPDFKIFDSALLGAAAAASINAGAESTGNHTPTHAHGSSDSEVQGGMRRFSKTKSLSAFSLQNYSQGFQIASKGLTQTSVAAFAGASAAATAASATVTAANAAAQYSSNCDGTSSNSQGSSAFPFPISPIPNSMSVKTILKKEKSIGMFYEGVDSADPSSNGSIVQQATKKKTKVQFVSENEVLNYEESIHDRRSKSIGNKYEDILFFSDDECIDYHATSERSSNPKITVLEQVSAMPEDITMYTVGYVSPNPPAAGLEDKQPQLLDDIIENMQEQRSSSSNKKKESKKESNCNKEEIMMVKRKKEVEENNLKLIMDKIKITKTVKANKQDDNSQKPLTQSSTSMALLAGSLSQPLSMVVKKPQKKKNSTCNIFSFLLRG